MMRRRLSANLSVAVLCLTGLTAACGGNDSTSREIDPDWAEFCFLATDLLAKTQFSHTPDPTALATLGILLLVGGASGKPSVSKVLRRLWTPAETILGRAYLTKRLGSLV